MKGKNQCVECSGWHNNRNMVCEACRQLYETVKAMLPNAKPGEPHVFSDEQGYERYPG